MNQGRRKIALRLSILFAIALAARGLRAADTRPTTQTLADARYTPPAGWTASDVVEGTRRFTAPETDRKHQTSILLTVKDVVAGQPANAGRTFGEVNAEALKGWKIVEPVRMSPNSQTLHQCELIRQSVIADDKEGHRSYIDVLTITSSKKTSALIFMASSPESYVKYRPASEQLAESLAAGQESAAPPPAAPGAAPAAMKLPDESEIVTRHADGTLGVAEKSGKPIDGLELSTHNLQIYSPSIAVAPDGTIHVVFVEQHSGTFKIAVYHRSSKDAGKTWTDASNLSEEPAGWLIGNCKLMVDARNRTYVIWRTGLKEGLPAPAEEYVGDQHNNHTNLLYRVLDGGKWSKVLPVNTPATPGNSANGPLQWFAGVDASGNVQVVWNSSPDALHPELLQNGIHVAAIYAGLIWQATLDGVIPTQPRPIYMAPVTVNPRDVNRGRICDGFGVMTAYFDKAGVPHILAAVLNAEAQQAHPVFHLVEEGKQHAALDGAGQSNEVLRFPPVLLLDARGRRHAIAIQSAGEHPHVRDSLLGSKEAPIAIRTAGKTIQGMEAFQGPGGRMVVFMQMNDTDTQGDTNTYVSISDGGPWSAPIDITNNSARNTFMSKDIGLITNGSVLRHSAAGTAAGAFDKDGHLLVLTLNAENALGTVTTGRWVRNIGSSSPSLRFLRF